MPPVEQAGGNATVSDLSAPSITKTATPFDGSLVAISGGLFTPIWSTAANIYITQPVTISTVQQTRAVRLNKSYVTQENVQVYADTFNGDPGHQQASIAVTAAGTVITWPEGHAVTWRGKHSTSSQNLSTLTDTAQPLYGASEQNAYRRYFRNPNNGDMWMTARGYGWYGYLRKWDETTKTWVNKGSNLGIAGFGAAYDNSIYGQEIAWASNGTMYFLVEWSDGGTGYPRRDAAVMKSVDDGVTWTTMTGGTITLPLVPGATNIAMPSQNAIRNVVQARLGVDASGNPIVVSAYRKPLETKRSLYYSRWVPGADRFEYQKIMTYNASNDGGDVSLTYYNGTVYVIVSGYDEHSDPNWTTAPPYTNWANKAPLYILSTSNGGSSWKRYTLDDGLGADAFWGAYFDPEALRLDSKFRIMPICGTTFSKSEVWEFTLP